MEKIEVIFKVLKEYGVDISQVYPQWRKDKIEFTVITLGPTTLPEVIEGYKINKLERPSEKI